MLISYLKLSLRLMARNPFFTFINVAGLSIGFASFFVLWQYSQTELKSDQFHKDWKRIARSVVIWKWMNDNGDWEHQFHGAIIPEIVNRIKTDYPGEIEATTRILFQYNFSYDNIAHGSKISLSNVNKDQQKISFWESNGSFADENVFEFFSIPLLAGNPHHVLQSANAIVLSEKTAYKYFGKDDPVGKILFLNDDTPLTVTGVFKNLPRNTHLDFEFVISALALGDKISIMHFRKPGGRFHGYFKMKEGTDVKLLENKIGRLRDKYWAGWLNYFPNTDADIFFQPLADISFSSFGHDKFTQKSKFRLQALSAIALIILVMGWINYVNLSLSSYGKRIKELAARKSNGATTTDIAWQFIAEAFLMNIFAVFISITLLQLFRYPMELWLEFYLPNWNQISFTTMAFLSAVITLGIIFTGFYPAVAILKKTPKSLFGTFRSGPAGSGFSNLLTTFQLSFALMLIVWVFAVYLQVNFIFNKDIGLEKEAVYVVDLPVNEKISSELNVKSFQESIAQMSTVKDFAVCTKIMGDMTGLYAIEVGKKNDDKLYPSYLTNGGVDEHFIPFFGIKLLAGRNFSPDNPADHYSLIFSRKAIERLGISDPDDAIGTKCDPGWYGSPEMEIIGVIEDYENNSFLNSLHSRDGGIVLTYKHFVFEKLRPNKLALRFNTNDWPNAIRQVEDKFAATFSGSAFNGNFLDDIINRQYNSELTNRNQIFVFTILAIGISCLGLLAMISNKAINKTKEIGIRKVLGAQMHHIAALLLNITIKQTLIAIFIGIPVAYYLVQKTFERFYEHITLHWWHYAIPVLILIAILFATIASVLIRAAKANPVESLRYE